MRLFFGLLTFCLALHQIEVISQEITMLKAPPKFNNFVNNNIGYLDFVPLSPTYPPDYLPKERVFTGEVYSKDPGSAISIEEDLFVPKDYLNILESTFTNTLKSGHLQPKRYSSVQDAQKDSIPLVICGIPVEFKVKGESNAIVKIYYRFYDTYSNQILWEGEIRSSFINTKLPSSLKNDKGKNIDIFMLSNHQYNFQPQRALLALAVYNSTVDLMYKLKEKWPGNKKK